MHGHLLQPLTLGAVLAECLKVFSVYGSRKELTEPEQALLDFWLFEQVLDS